MNPAPSLDSNLFKMHWIKPRNKNGLEIRFFLNKGEGAG